MNTKMIIAHLSLSLVINPTTHCMHDNHRQTPSKNKASLEITLSCFNKIRQITADHENMRQYFCNLLNLTSISQPPIKTTPTQLLFPHAQLLSKPTEDKTRDIDRVVPSVYLPTSSYIHILMSSHGIAFDAYHAFIVTKNQSISTAWEKTSRLFEETLRKTINEHK